MSSIMRNCLCRFPLVEFAGEVFAHFKPTAGVVIVDLGQLIMFIKCLLNTRSKDSRLDGILEDCDKSADKAIERQLHTGKRIGSSECTTLGGS